MFSTTCQDTGLQREVLSLKGLLFCSAETNIGLLFITIQLKTFFHLNQVKQEVHRIVRKNHSEEFKQ